MSATPPRSLVNNSGESKKRLEEFWVLALKDPSWGLKNLYGRVMGHPFSGPLPSAEQLSKLQKIWWAANKVPEEIRLLMNKILLEADVQPFLGKLNVPTLILHGENDMLPIEAAKRMKERIPQSQLHIFKDATFTSMSRPDEFNRVLEEFLSAGKVTAE